MLASLSGCVEDARTGLVCLAAVLQQAQSALTSSRLALTSAALKDLNWLTMIRTRLMPKQAGRVPFHNSKEVAFRGYHAAAGAQRAVPILREVTWSPVVVRFLRVTFTARTGLVAGA